MNKSHLAEVISVSAEVSKAKAAKMIDAMSHCVAERLAAGVDVSIAGLGTFKAVKRAAREGRNPLTGEKIKIPARVAPKFTAAKALKDAVWKRKGKK